MPDIKLPDGKKIPFSKTINGFDIAKKISKSLEKAALIMEVDGQLRDLSHQIKKESKVKMRFDSCINNHILCIVSGPVVVC